MPSWFFDAFSIHRDSGSRVAILGAEANITYGQLADTIEEKRQELRKLGIIRGAARVAFTAESTLSSIIVFFALLSLEASPCPLSIRLPKDSVLDLCRKKGISFLLNPETNSLERLCSNVYEDSSIFLFTSGSTGTPKLASLRFSNFLENALGSVKPLELNPESRWLLSVPLFHVSGLSILFRSFLAGSTVLLGSLSSPILESATHVSFVPTQLIRLLAQKTPLPSLRCLLLGGAPIHESLLEKALIEGLPIKTTYGLTETASMLTLSSDDLTIPHLGKTLPGRELKIGEDGEILVKGTTLFSGYADGLALSSPKVEGDLFPTGDLGIVTPEGNLVYKGRKDNLFISGGENIYPEEIEKALSSLPGVLASVVVPADDPEFGQRPVAFVEMQNGSVSESELREKLSSQIPKFCIPTRFFPFPEGVEKDLKIKRNFFKQLASQIKSY